MVVVPTDLSNNRLSNKEEFYITYSGPSFDGQIELDDLRTQLKAIDRLIKESIDGLFENKTIPVDSSGVKIYLKLERGSFAEIISVVLTHPVASAVVASCIAELFKRFLGKRNGAQNVINIEKMTTINFVRNVNKIVIPLRQRGDRVEIRSRTKPDVRTDVVFEEKGRIEEYMNELDKKSVYEVYEEEFFGNLSRVDLLKDTFGFNPEESANSIPVVFESHLDLNEIKKILGERIKIKARATYKNGELHKLDIEGYALKRRKNLKDFGDDEKNGNNTAP